MRLAVIAAVVSCAILGLCRAEPSVAAFVKAPTQIAPQELSSALQELAKDRNFQIICRADLVKGIRTQGVSGDFTPYEALSQLLSGTGLVYRALDNQTVTIVAPDATTPSPASQDSTASDSTHETVVVAGSRLKESAQDSPVPTNVYTRERIDQSGTATVMSFLNTLPEASVQTTTTGDNQQLAGATVVQLRGLPAGTTLVLVDGRRVSSSSGLLGANGGAFDLNSIPLAAVERIEVIPSGSSAIYGGDALGGVVNIVMKKNFNGVEANVRYGQTDGDDYHETQFNLAAGTGGSSWSLSAVLLYSTNSELVGADRALSANNDYTAFGGFDNRSINSDPGNVCSANGAPLTGLTSPCAGIPRGGSGIGLTPASFAATDGKLNYTSTSAFESILSPARKYGAFIHASHDLWSGAEVFTDLLYNHLDQRAYLTPPHNLLAVAPGNPNNPFGEDVTVNYRFTALGRGCYCQDTDFIRPLLGFRGTFGEHWDWEVAGWTTRDWDSVPYTTGVENHAAVNSAITSGAFNPFADGAGATAAVLSTFFSNEEEHLRSATDSVNGFLRGQLLQLPAGPVEGLVGAEFQRDTLAMEIPSISGFDFEFHRRNSAAFMELKVPILPGRPNERGTDMLTTQFALRYDHYSDFGSRTSPQAGIVFRPIQALTLRVSYSAAFKPPPLYDLYAPGTSYPGVALIDPLRGNASEDTTLHYAGNPGLRAETGWSRNVGLVFAPAQIPDFDLTLTQWTIHLKNGFIEPQPGFFVSNASTYPGTVVRAAPAAGDPYGVGPITDLYELYENIGFIHESGVDLAVQWRARTRVGDFMPSLSVNNVYQYDYELDPTLGKQSGLSQANDNASYAPRWKAVMGVNWTNGLLTLGAMGRYTGRYRDVTDVRSDPKELGNFAYVDFNARFELGKALSGESGLWSRAFVAAGVRNAFNKLPPYADYGYGELGYDPNEYDLEGRFMWLQAGVRL